MNFTGGAAGSRPDVPPGISVGNSRSRITTVISGTAEKQRAGLYLRTVSGKTVMERTVYYDRTSIDITHQPAGVYIARLTGATGSRASKILPVK